MSYKVLGAVQAEPYVKDGKSIPKVTLEVNHEGKSINVGYFTNETPANLIGKELDFTVEEKTSQNGNVYYVAKKTKTDSGGGKFQKSNTTIKLDILNAISEIDKWTAIMDLKPLEVAEKLYKWVKEE